MSGASPAVSSPARNVPTPASSGSRPPTRSVSSPETTMPTTEVTSSAVNDQPYQASPSSSRTAVGSAVATAIASKAIRLMSPTIPAVAARYGRARMPSLSLPTVALVSRGRGCRFPAIQAVSGPAAGAADTWVVPAATHAGAPGSGAAARA